MSSLCRHFIDRHPMQPLACCLFIQKAGLHSYVNPYYTIWYHINTWSGHWHSYDNRGDWLMYNGSIIRLDPAKINKGRKRNMRIPMVMDETESRINGMPTRGRGRCSGAWFRLPFCLYFLSFYLPEQLDFNCCSNILICLTLF
jgi:hypothetical protein